ncbi:rhodanese-like domain-containing protein [Hydrocarboniclastica marina]|uniref:Rhodanese-like domain-containing protein n=1 Tax=Hydrocarboniclastica marina TaxID=2259620 RepID=A0A4P7XIG6_9ALTE|nr:rhodanese-like domain-containing protein [Hydrocarboniclastica marina]MAL99163.1 sulfurtransferase [Alteromonadaceae bacterium]QCF26846.1 rhodanese-like domain-containing protein [Hydrocarboniclastica marina]|tara:strand:+ start:906 stop:1322 length:417 start_codon:yes stop_codon:yes gene_type:complete
MERVIEFATNHYILVISFFSLLGLLLLSETRRAGRKVSAQELVTLLNRDGAVVVDLRDRKEFREGHIRGSINIPVASLKERESELTKHADKQVVLVDKAGQHAGIASKQLRSAGFENVVRLSGGVMDWRGANLPLVKK